MTHVTTAQEMVHKLVGSTLSEHCCDQVSVAPESHESEPNRILVLDGLDGGARLTKASWIVALLGKPAAPSIKISAARK